MIGDKKLRLPYPVDPKFRISSPFGYREDPFTKEKIFHKGIDFAAPVGTPVYCVAKGYVFMAGYEDPFNQAKGFGLRIWQRFEYEGVEYYCWYGHLSEIFTEENREIVPGKIIGRTGNSGRSSGPHLHFQVRKINTGDFYDVEFYELKKEPKNGTGKKGTDGGIV